MTAQEFKPHPYQEDIINWIATHKRCAVWASMGSGKSVVSRIFRQLGIPVYDADAAARSLYDRHPELVEKIAAEMRQALQEKTMMEQGVAGRGEPVQFRGVSGGNGLPIPAGMAGAQ